MTVPLFLLSPLENNVFSGLLRCKTCSFPVLGPVRKDSFVEKSPRLHWWILPTVVKTHTRCGVLSWEVKGELFIFWWRGQVPWEMRRIITRAMSPLCPNEAGKDWANTTRVYWALHIHDPINAVLSHLQSKFDQIHRDRWHGRWYITMLSRCLNPHFRISCLMINILRLNAIFTGLILIFLSTSHFHH